MSDAAEAYAQWRIDNPASIGWAQVAFMAGWEARDTASDVIHESDVTMIARLTLQRDGWRERALGGTVPPVICAIDMSPDGGATVVVMRRTKNGGLEVLGETAIRLPTSGELAAEMKAYRTETGIGYCNLPGGCTCIDKPNPAVQQMHCKSWKVERI